MEGALTDRRYLALGRVAEMLSKGSDLDALLVPVLAAARDAIPAAEKGSILFWDEVFQTLHVSHVIGYDDPRASKATFPVTRGYAARCARERRPLVIADARRDDDIRYDGEIEELRAIRSAVLAPLLAGSRLLGVISPRLGRAGSFRRERHGHVDDPGRPHRVGRRQRAAPVRPRSIPGSVQNVGLIRFFGFSAKSFFPLNLS